LVVILSYLYDCGYAKLIMVNAALGQRDSHDGGFLSGWAANGIARGRLFP
jgi:hypothetical protein